MRTCRLCGSQSIPEDGFHGRSLSPRNGTVICSPCWDARQRGYEEKYAAKTDPNAIRASKDRYVQNNPEKRRATRRKWLFGITEEQMQARLEAQGHACALCKTPFGDGETFIDHDHDCCPESRKKTCGHCVRAILCRKCNQGLGMFNDDPELLVQAAMYVMQLRDTLPQFGLADPV